MALDRFATDEEKGWLLEVVEESHPCRQIFLEGAAEVHPQIVSMLLSWFAEDTENMAAIIQDEITLGDANRRFNRLDPQRAAELTRLAERIAIQF